MIKLALLPLALVLFSCEVKRDEVSAPNPQTRKIASLDAAETTVSEELSFNRSISEKLSSLHTYYVIGQKNLELFDRLAEHEAPKKLLKSRPYLKLLAVRTQVEEIEHQLFQTWKELQPQLSPEKATRRRTLDDLVRDFAKKSKLSAMSMENLLAQLELSTPLEEEKSVDPTLTEIEEEYKKLEVAKEFQVFETNVEHLSYMMEINASALEKKFYPSVEGHGNITGNEFPAKVWSLTFDDGPGAVSLATSARRASRRGRMTVVTAAIHPARCRGSMTDHGRSS